jgi:tRNA(fMet)-specific endonuclease VapC
MRILLDTNIITALNKGDTELIERIDGAIAVFIPIIVLGELYYGACYSQHVEANLQRINIIRTNYPVAYVDDAVTKEYGRIKAQLRKNGTPVPENDIWIAAIAAKNDYTLISRDKHFQMIDSINVKNW